MCVITLMDLDMMIKYVIPLKWILKIWHNVISDAVIGVIPLSWTHIYSVA